MFKRNDGQGINAIQNKFTAFLKACVRNKKLEYIKKQRRMSKRETTVENLSLYMGFEEDFADVIADYDVIRRSFRVLNEKERNIIISHLIHDKGFDEIGKQYGSSYKATAATFYRAMNKLREEFGRYNDGF